MTKEDEDYTYHNEIGRDTIFWKLSEIEWQKFEDLIMSESISMPIRMIWFKEASEEMNMIKYVFDTCSGDMEDLRSSAKSTGEVDVFVEYDISEHIIGYLSGHVICGGNEDDDGYEPDHDERMGEEGYKFGDDERLLEEGDDDLDDDDDMPPKEDDDPEESGDERPAEEKGKEGLNEMHDQGDGNQSANVQHTEVGDEDDVVIDIGAGGDDDRFQSVSKEGARRHAELNEATRKLAKEQATEEREEEEEEEETDPEFGLEDVKYPNTSLDTYEEWEQWKNPNREKRKEKFHGDLDKEPYI